MKKNFKLTAGLLGLALTAAAAQAGISAGENVTFPLTDTVDLEMIWVEPGTFMMGSPADELGRDNFIDETLHQVTLTKGYWLGKYEITQAQYEAVTGRNPVSDSSLFGVGGDHPVYYISWGVATSFCSQLTERERAAGRLPEGYEFTLPTEAQWEYACRAGTTTAFNNGTNIQPGEEVGECLSLGEVAWYRENSNGMTQPVGQKKPNAWGFYDMHGNVEEWCTDKYGDYPAGPVTDPTGAETGSSYIHRGGNWRTFPCFSRSAYRNSDGPTRGDETFGLRVALIKTQQDEPATISCKAEGNVLVINYTGTLYQSTDTVNWTEVAGATSPYKVTMGEKMLFFRTQGGVPIYKNMTIPLGDDVELDMIWIDPGTFMMGSPENEIGRDGEEYLHSETIRFGFWLGKYEVTHEQYKAIMGENPSQFSGSGKPVETVSWYDAMSFCEKLTAREKEAGRLPAGYKYTLPTSVEWEYACRAGTTTAFNNGTNIPTEEQATEPCPNLDQVGWYDYNSNSAVHTVGQKKPNAWGLYDMHGNVNEWTSSKPEGREDEDLYIIRGGDWESWPYSCRSAYWHMQGPDVREYWYGFRVALAAIP